MKGKKKQIPTEEEIDLALNEFIAQQGAPGIDHRVKSHPYLPPVHYKRIGDQVMTFGDYGTSIVPEQHTYYYQ